MNRSLEKVREWKRRSKPLSGQSKKRKAEQKERRRLIDRMKANGPVLCRRCGRLADDLHELLSRARGGSISSAENTCPLCRGCHDWITTHPREAEAEGWALRRGA